MKMCGKVYDIAKITTSIIVRKFCVAVRIHLKPLVIPKLIRNKSKKLQLVLNVYMEFLAS
jgi:hypothetical protein